MRVAILIPTINRLGFIERTLSYYDSLKSQHPIYIGDASSVEISQKTRTFLDKIIDAEVHYYHWEGLGGVQTCAKLAEEASADYEFCAYQGDDDYFIPSSLTKCAEFLSENPNYRTAQGLAALVAMDSPEPVCNIRAVGQYWGKNSLDESSKYGRLSSFNKNYYVLQFSVHRIGEFINDSRDYSTIEDGLRGEVLHCYTFAINGKSKFIDCLYLIRVRHPDLLIHSGGDIFDRITHKNWSHEYNIMIDSLSRELCDDGAISPSEAKEVISDMMKERLKQGCFNNLKNTENHKQSPYIKLKSIIPDRLKNTFKLVRDIMLSPASESVRKKNDMELLVGKGARFYTDFMPVVNSLTGKGLPDI